MNYEAAIKVFNSKGRIVSKTISAKSEEALAKKLEKIEESGNLYEVVGFSTN